MHSTLPVKAFSQETVLVPLFQVRASYRVSKSTWEAGNWAFFPQHLHAILSMQLPMVLAAGMVLRRSTSSVFLLPLQMVIQFERSFALLPSIRKWSWIKARGKWTESPNRSGNGPGINHPSPTAQEAVIRKAYARACLDFSQTGYFEWYAPTCYTFSRAGCIKRYYLTSQ